MRPKTFAVLRYLLTHAGQLVTKDELLAAVWPGIRISATLPKDSVQELRRVLGDDPRAPRFIETVHGRGYRFIGKVVSSQHLVVSRRGAGSGSQLTTDHWQLTTPLVGRETELAQLHGWFERALHGERQVVFVTGEPGIGKTTLVDAFLKRAAVSVDLWIGYGQCIEQYGAGEAYLPILDALGRLCRAPNSERLLSVLARYAPTWLMQMPWLLSDAEQKELLRKTRGATRERMLREMAIAVEMLAVDKGFVLWLEDLHWADPSSLDLISLLARRREPVQLLLIGTYRPGEVLPQRCPLQTITQELQMHDYCQELPLGFLTVEEVADYLTTRFSVKANAPLQRLAHKIHLCTEGNPLFMVHVVDDWVAQGLVGENNEQGARQIRVEAVGQKVPESLRQMIEKQIDRLSPVDQRILAAASVAGMECSAAAVAAGLGRTIVESERLCEGLARRGQFLQSNGTEEWPDGTVAGRYRFSHSLYQNVCYERMPPAWRIQLHQQIAKCKEQSYGERTREIAAELAVHYEATQDYRRAVEHHRQAAETAIRRYAYQEARDHLTRGLELLKRLLDTPERTQQELVLQLALAVSLTATTGYGTPEVEKVLIQAQQLCQQADAPAQHCSVLSGLTGLALMRAEFQKARMLGEQALSLAHHVGDPAVLSNAYLGLGEALFFLGDIVAARTYLEKGNAFSNPEQFALRLLPHDPAIACHAFTAWVLGALGYPDQAVRTAHEALARAEELAHPHTLAFALHCAAAIHLFLHWDGQTVQKLAEAEIALAHEHGFPFWQIGGHMMHGCALVELGQREAGIAQIQHGLAAYLAVGMVTGRSSMLGFIAEAYGKGGQIEEGLAVLADAFATMQRSEERLVESMLYQIKGEFLLTRSEQDQEGAEACFLHAIDTAHRQSARLLELRAATSLSRLWYRHGKTAEARQRLAETYGWFTEGFESADLKEARALLTEMT